MENFNKENIKNEKSFEQLESFDLSTLKAQAELSNEQKAKIEQTHEQNQTDSRQEVLDAFGHLEENGDRQTSPFNHFETQANNEKNVSNIIHLSGYDANFATYGDLKGFELRANTGESQEYLQEENTLRKGQIHVISAQDRRKNLARAFMQTFGFDRAA